MDYTPKKGPPIPTEEEDLGKVVDWVEIELALVENAFKETTRHSYQELHVAPSKPREGDVALADGTDWNPGQGAGLYQYTNGAWLRIRNETSLVNSLPVATVLALNDRVFIYDTDQTRDATILVSSVKAKIAPPWTIFVHTVTNSNWPVSSNYSEMEYEAIGGGASGAAGNTGASSRGSGGGSGSRCWGYTSGTLDSALNIVVATSALGTTATTGGANGVAGGATTITGTVLGTITAGGGARGNLGAASGGVGGTATGATLNISGQAGQVGQNGGAIAAVAAGGSAPGGGPGGQSNVGEDGLVPGGGGACGNHTAGAVSGAGARGWVIIKLR